MIKRPERSPRILTSFIYFLAASFTLVLAKASLAADWEHIYEDDGINVFRQEVEGTSLLAFRGTGYIDAPIEKVLHVFSDVKHETDWVDRLEENILLSEDMKNFERIEFHSYGLPWPVWSRDIVFKIKLTRLKSDTFLVTMKSVDDSLGPPTKGVRAELHGSNFILRQTADGKTWVEVDIFIDPKGEVPAFLVNILQRYWPYNTITGLRSQVKKPFVKTFVGPALAEPARGSLKQVQP